MKFAKVSKILVWTEGRWMILVSILIKKSLFVQSASEYFFFCETSVLQVFIRHLLALRLRIIDITSLKRRCASTEPIQI